MKLSVSVPDELWDRARRLVDDGSASAVVQAALVRFVGGTADADYAVRPVLDRTLAEKMEAARVRVIEDARELFQEGYRDGIKLAGALGFSQLEYIVQTGSRKVARSMAAFALDIDLGRSNAPPGTRPLIDPDILVEYLGSYADYTGAVDWTPSRPTVEGIDRALTDVWDRVNNQPDEPEEPL